jgi:tripartite ATP-independent transporter DctP family solute receptor
MKKIVFLSLCIFLLVGFGAFAGGAGESSQGGTGKVQRIAISHTNSGASPWEKASQAFSRMVNEQAGSRYQVQTYPNGQLCQGNWSIMLEMVQSGSTQIGVEALTALATLNEDINIFSMPFVFQDVEHVARFLNSGTPIWEKWMEQFEKSRIVVLGVAPRPMRQLSNNQRIVKTPADIAGMKFRVSTNPMFVQIFEAIGAKPVPLPSGEIYSAIQLGTVNGEDNAVQTQYDFKTHEVSKNFTIWNYVADGVVIFMNKDFYDAASPEDKALFSEAGKKFVETDIMEDTQYFNTAYTEMEKAGVKFYTMTDAEKEPFKQLLAGFYKTYEGKYSPADWKAFFDAVNATAKK